MMEGEAPDQNPSRSSAARRWTASAASIVSLLVACACEEPQLGPKPLAASSAGAASSATGSSATAAVARASTPPAPPPAAETGLDAGVDLAPALHAPDGTPLAQTRDRPSTESSSFRQRLDRLVEAIAMDDPERAMPAFFPRIAYEQVKAVADPGRDWQQRLVAAFRRDIHEYHRALGPDAARAKLAGLVTNENAVRWIEPGKEGNRLGYYRVTRSRLRFRWDNGAERLLELTSLISWRGEWYVVHLHGFG
jgi:hypothetical protein